MNEDVVIEDYADGFAIFINGEEFFFDQENDRQGLVDVFQQLGYSASYIVGV